MFVRSSLTVVLLAISTRLGFISGHGYLYEPPARSSLWRHSIDGSVVNNDDNALFCGGYWVLWGLNNGKCGVCGDRWDTSPHENEAGGKYARGIISRLYKAGSDINVTINLTANHKGYFEFRLCENNDIYKPATHACFERHLLSLTDGSTRYYVTSGTGYKQMQVKLPVGITCHQCILQWKYNTGNFWDCDATGCGPGFGHQEQYYNCADIAIV